MAGCYGNSGLDRYYEEMLDRWLNEHTREEEIEAIEQED